MRVMGWIFLVLGVYFLVQGFTMPMIAERSDVESSEFMQIREASSHLGIGLMIGAVACGLLGRVQGGAGTRPPVAVPPQSPPSYPPQQAYQPVQQPQSGWQAPPQQ